ncbi:hypothetical protein [Azospirillum brasilense]|nr:hypothetical protein [Azospirillum brasilense]
MNKLIDWMLDRGWSPEMISRVLVIPLVVGGGLIGFVIGRITA